MVTLREQALRLHAVPRAGLDAVRLFLAPLPATEDHAAAAIAGARLSLVLRDAGDLSAAFAAGLEARGRAELVGDMVALSLAGLALGQVLYSVGQLQEAKEWFERAAALPDIPASYVVRARTAVAAALRAQGRLAEATEAFDILTSHLDGVPPEVAATALINAASCWHQVDRVDAARAGLARALDILVPGERPDLWIWHDAILAWVEGAGGDADAALTAARAALEPSRSPSLEVRSSAVRALTRVALDTGALLRRQILEQTLPVLASAEKAGARQQAVDLHLCVSQLCEAQGDLIAAVEHLRSARALGDLLAGDENKLRQEKERLRLELARMQVEADTLRTSADALVRANRALAASDGARVRLLRTLAHDLRNPLMSVFGAVDLIDPYDPDEVKASVAQIEASAERMKAILEGALKPSTTAGWPIVDIATVASQCAAAFSGLAAKKGQSLLVSHEGNTSLSTDSEALGRIVDNLLSNALKYSGSQTEVRIVVLGTDGRVDVSVLDEGPGLPELDAADGLMLGSRLASRATDGEASWGIGLHTVYELAAELGGILALGNRPEGGAAVRVSLPRDQSASGGSL